MTEPELEASAGPQSDPSPDSNALIASLRATGAARFDPVHLRCIEAMAERSAGHHGPARRLLDARLAQMLEAFRTRFDTARHEARASLAHGISQYPHAASDLQRLFDSGDFRSLRRLIATLASGEQRATLAALVRRLEQASADDAQPRSIENVASRPELKTIRNFRNTWSRLSADKQVTQALRQAPKNAGPINSHMLVLRSLSLMRDISPDYLNRFMSYADALLCLDQAEKEKQPVPRKNPATRKTRK